MRTFVILKAFVLMLLVLETFDVSFRKNDLTPSKTSEWKSWASFWLTFISTGIDLNPERTLKTFWLSHFIFMRTPPETVQLLFFLFSHDRGSSVRWGTDQCVVLTASRSPEGTPLGLLSKWVKPKIWEKKSLTVMVLSVRGKIWPRNANFDYRICAFSVIKKVYLSP